CFCICLFFRSIHTTRCKRNSYIMSGIFGSFFNGYATTQDNKIGEGNFFVSGLRVVEIFLDLLEFHQNFLKLWRIVHFPMSLWRKAYTRAISSSPLIGNSERRRRSPGSGNQL